MFNIGPLELMVLAIVGLVVLGPDRLPGLARDAARMIRTLRDLAQGARTQLRDELGPEFADLDLRNLDPRNAIQSVLGDDLNLSKDLRKLSPKAYLQDAILGADEQQPSGGGVSMTKPAARPAEAPLGRDEPAPFDPDAT
jgi:sec-independent protein translocase protein TatB